MSEETAEDRQLRRLVTWHRRGAVAIGALVLAAYVGRVLYTGERTPSADAWGTFGDFIGGILNPMIAYMALYWLTQSVLIQKAELRDTQLALKDTAVSQSEQAAAASESVRLAALGALLSSLDVEISECRKEVTSLMVQGDGKRAYLDANGHEISPEERADYITSLQDRITHASMTKQMAVLALQEVLRQMKSLPTHLKLVI